MVVNSILKEKGKLSSARIDEFISQSRSEGKSVYLIDSERLKEIKPDLIITQGLCDVCAVSENEVTEVCEILESSPEILSLEPSTVSEIMDSVLLLGEITGTKEKASQIVDGLRKRIESVEKKTLGRKVTGRGFSALSGSTLLTPPGTGCRKW